MNAAAKTVLLVLKRAKAVSIMTELDDLLEALTGELT